MFARISQIPSNFFPDSNTAIIMEVPIALKGWYLFINSKFLFPKL